MNYAIWYDNGSGYLEPHELRDELKFDSYPYRQVATAGYNYDPNVDAAHILAESAEAAAARLENYGYMMCVTEEKPDAILVGRHASADLPYRIVEQRNVVFSTDVEECKTQVEELFAAAHEAEAVLLFQNIPGIVACAITQIAARNAPTHLRGIGVIISKPGPREAGKVIDADHGVFDVSITREEIDHYLGHVLTQANPNVKLVDGKFTVDPPMKFVFDKVEWLF